MDFGWIHSVLELLFGRLGALGTLFVGAFAYVAWQLHIEQREHRETRKLMEELNEKRLLLHAENIRAIEQLRQAMLSLSEAVRSSKRRASV